MNNDLSIGTCLNPNPTLPNPTLPNRFRRLSSSAPHETSRAEIEVMFIVSAPTAAANGLLFGQVHKIEYTK